MPPVTVVTPDEKRKRVTVDEWASMNQHWQWTDRAVDELVAGLAGDCDGQALSRPVVSGAGRPRASR